jgi:RND family efflux transporter MFP subunit
MMGGRRGIIRTTQVCLLILAAWLLYHWWSVKPPAIVSDDAIDDLIEEVGDTYVPVHEGNIERGTLRHYVIAYGIVQPAVKIAGQEAASASVSSSAVAAVATVQCAEGQSVTKGQNLFTLDPRGANAAIEHAQQLVDADRAAMESIKPPSTVTATTATTLPATMPGWWSAIASRQLAVDQAALDLSKSQRDLLTVASPINGTVTNLNIAVGEMSDPSKPAVEIVDLDRLVATIDVPPAMLGQLHVGQSAEIEFSSSESATTSTTQPTPIVGSVVLVDSTLNPTTGMGSADIALPPGSGLLPGRFVQAKITTAEEPDRLMVPTLSITQNQNGDPAVGKIETDGRWAVLVPVTTGWRDGDKTEIEGEGLAAGQAVVTIGANGLVQRTRLHLLKD